MRPVASARVAVASTIVLNGAALSTSATSSLSPPPLLPDGTCSHEPQAPTRACAGVPGADPASCTPADAFFRWHVTSQELLIRHLRQLWPDDQPRVMVDLGSHAGHGIGRNVSDALLWLDHFHAPGSLVVAVDAIEDYAFDLQHRMDELPPYAAMMAVRKRSLHAAVASGGGTPLTDCSEAVVRGSAAALGSIVLRSTAASRRLQCVDLSLAAAYTTEVCSRTDGLNDLERMDRAGASDHVCRIPRQRAGVSASTLPLPPSSNNYTFTTKPYTELYLAPVTRTDWLVRAEVGGHRRVDLLKIDVDMPWTAMREELTPLFRRRAFRVMVVELDNQDRPEAAALEDIACLAHAHGYATLLKVPCAGSGHMQEATWRSGPWQFPTSHRAAYLPVSGRYQQGLPESWGTNGSAPCVGAGGQHCNVQDVLLLDSSSAELGRLVELGNAECGTHFPTDLTPAWAALPKEPAEASSSYHSPLPGSLVGEREVLRPSMWKGAKRPTPRAARRLPDGTWSCMLAKGESAEATAPMCKT